MDTFKEQLYARRKTFPMVAAQVGIVALATALSAAVLWFVPIYVQFIGLMLAAVIVFGIVYGAYKLYRSFDIEYEYTFYADGALDIDQITARMDRKRILSLDCKNFEEFGDYTGNEDKIRTVDRVFNFSSNTGAPQKYAVVSNVSGYKRIMIVIEPEEEILTTMESIWKRISFTRR